MIHIDGSIGEGGGQILRTALSLSLLTGTPFHLSNIRAGRKKAGLMRQHLVCVHAAKQIGQAVVTGDHLHSTELTFTPHTVQTGHYHFPIGSAGSTLLVLQTLLPVLMMQAQPSTLRIEGGTHNPMAPTVDFIEVTIQPWTDRKALSLLDRGDLIALNAYAGVQRLESHIAERELLTLHQHLDLNSQQLINVTGCGQGNTVYVEVVSAHHTEVFSALGEHNRSAEQVAKHLAGKVKRYLHQTAAVDEYLADQLLLPLALGKGGQYTCRVVSEHTRTQAWMIEQFLPVHVTLPTPDQSDICVTV
jgi:RNA 3'-terminal phosphate cyclase (ATP)